MNDLYANEAYERWGQFESYKESQKELAKYSKVDIESANAQMQAATDLIKEALINGASPDSDLATKGAEAHRQSISQWWYTCDYQMHKHLAQMYLEDERFKKNYEDQATGLAQFMHDAIFANALKHE